MYAIDTGTIPGIPCHGHYYGELRLIRESGAYRGCSLFSLYEERSYNYNDLADRALTSAVSLTERLLLKA